MAFRETKKDFENFSKEFEELLQIINFKSGIKGFVRECLLFSAILSIAVLYYGLFEAKSERIAVLSIPVFIMPFILNYFLKIYFFERRKNAIEEDVPDLLLLASSLPERAGTQQLIMFMASTAKGPLQEEFEKAEIEINAGATIETALERIKKRNKSLALSRAIDLILNALHSGAEMNSTFREIAQDFMETNSILRERAASTTIEKYTLLLAGGIIVPLILGLLAGVISKFDFSIISEIGIGMSAAAREKIVEAALLGNTIYIFEYAIIASVFVAFQEGNQKKAVLYAAVLVPLSFVAYFAGKILQ